MVIVLVTIYPNQVWYIADVTFFMMSELDIENDQSLQLDRSILQSLVIFKDQFDSVSLYSPKLFDG